MKYKQILLIDDDVDDQEIFNNAIERISDGLEYTALCSARSALQRLEDGTIRPDVIFLDLNMPIMGGREFLIEVKARDGLRDIPVIIFSTSSDAATVAATRDLGAIDFITKPNKISQLVEVLRQVLN